MSHLLCRDLLAIAAMTPPQEAGHQRTTPVCGVLTRYRLPEGLLRLPSEHERLSDSHFRSSFRRTTLLDKTLIAPSGVACLLELPDRKPEPALLAVSVMCLHCWACVAGRADGGVGEPGAHD